MKKIAVILCGSGYKDGSEIRESVATLWALSREGASVSCFAPNAPQHHVVNCLTGEEDNASTPRNMQVEAARIARGDVKTLDQLDMNAFDAVIIPGGFGVAKNLCTFAFDGSRGSVREDFKKILHQAHSQKRPIGAICIAPAAVAMAFPHEKLTLTLGEEGEAAQEMKKLGHTHRVCTAHDICVDETHRIVSTPAYMHASAPLHEIFEGIHLLVKRVLQMTE